MEIYFGGIGKEYAADRAGAGLLDAAQSTAGEPWWRRARHRCLARRHPGASWCRSRALSPARRWRDSMWWRAHWPSLAITSATSSSTVVVIAHVMDPHTGWPVSAWQSISVVAPLAVAAGAAPRSRRCMRSSRRSRSCSRRASVPGDRRRGEPSRGVSVATPWRSSAPDHGLNSGFRLLGHCAKISCTLDRGKLPSRVSIQSARSAVSAPPETHRVSLGATGARQSGHSPTFDDGPDPEVTLRLLDLFDELAVRATSFVIGEKAGTSDDSASDARRGTHGRRSLVGRHVWPIFSGTAAPRSLDSSLAATAGGLDRVRSLRLPVARGGHDAATDPDLGHARPPFGVLEPPVLDTCFAFRPASARCAAERLQQATSCSCTTATR